MLNATESHTAVCLTLTQAISTSRTVQEIYAASLDALESGLRVERSSILLFDADGVMRFKAWRGLSEDYRAAVEGHSPWTPESPNPRPLVIPDVRTDLSLAPYLPVFEAERIAALTFIPLVSLGRVIGKFMLYFAEPAAPSPDALQLASVIAAQVSFAVERTRAEEQARRSEERLRFALDAASMGTWDWDLVTNRVQWSDNLERIHGLPAGSFDGTFASYEREIHPEDRERVYASVQRALAEGVPHEVEYRLVAPDGTIRWCEGKGRVEYRDGHPARMSGVCMMVTRRKEAELARLAAAEESSRLKDEFLATLSHELRTPLNAILGWVQMLESGQLHADRRRQAIDVISRNARLQAQLIEDVLDVSRIITGKLEIEQVPVSVPQVLETATAGVAPALTGRHQTLETDIGSDLPPIQGDPRRLHQVFSNVLSNAIKFTPEGGSIRMDCASSGSWLITTIADSGVGIAREFLPYVFDRFRQADSRSTRRHGGLGLGLAIARHLVELHGGEIAADSDGVGKGTVVRIKLPIEPAMTVRPRPDDSVEPSDARLDGVAILIVDDQHDSREMLAHLLEQRGARVTHCDSAQSAMLLVASSSPHVVIADIAMPDVDGYELIRRLRQEGHQTPAVAVTAYARQHDRQQAIEAGYAAYCAKPVDGAALARLVRDLVPARA